MTLNLTVDTGASQVPPIYNNLLDAVNSLSTLTDDVVITCTGGLDSTTVRVKIDHVDAGFTCTIKADVGQEHNGAFNSNIYHHRHTGTTVQIEAATEGVSFEGIQLLNESTVTSAGSITTSSAVTVNVDNVIFKRNPTIVGSPVGILLNNASLVMNVKNCFFFDFQRTTGPTGFAPAIYSINGTSTIDSCTFRNCAYATFHLGGSIAVFNNLAQGSTIDGFDPTPSFTYTGTNNQSEDTSAFDEGVGEGGVEVAFVADGSCLWSGSQPCRDAGTDRSGAGVLLDITGKSRPQGIAYDVGAFEADPLGGVPYNSITGGSYNSITGGGYNSIIGGGYSSLT